MSTDPVLAGVLRACAREEGGVRALARAIAVSPQTIHGLLNGDPPGRHVRRALALYLGVRPEEVAAWAVERTHHDRPFMRPVPRSESPAVPGRDPATRIP